MKIDLISGDLLPSNLHQRHSVVLDRKMVHQQGLERLRTIAHAIPLPKDGAESSHNTTS